MTTQPAGRPRTPPRADVLGAFLLISGLLLLVTSMRYAFAVWFVAAAGLLLLMLSVSAFVPGLRHVASQALIGSSVLLAVLAYLFSDLSTMIPAAAGTMLLATAGVIQWVLARDD